MTRFLVNNFCTYCWNFEGKPSLSSANFLRRVGGAGEVCKGWLRNTVFKYHLFTRQIALVEYMHFLLIFKCNTLTALCICALWECFMHVLLCFQLTQTYCNMHNFKFNYLSRAQLLSLNLDKTFLPLLKILPCYEAFLVT